MIRINDEFGHPRNNGYKGFPSHAAECASAANKMFRTTAQFVSIVAALWIAVAPNLANAAVSYNTIAASGATGTNLGFGPQLGADVNFSSFNYPSINASGQVSFSGAIIAAASDTGVWSTSGGALLLRAREGVSSPGPNLGPGVTFVDFGTSSVALIDNAGEIAFSGAVTGTGISSANSSGIWTTAGGTLNAIARTGSQGPGPNVEAGSYFTGLAGPWFNSAGKLAFNAILNTSAAGTDSEGVWTNTSGALAPAARLGSVGPGPNVGAGVNFGPTGIFLATFTAAGPAFYGKLAGAGIDTSNDNGIWTNIGGSNTVVAREGAAGPGPNLGAGVTFSNLAFPSVGLSSAGQAVFNGTVSGTGIDTTNDTGIWTSAGGALTVVAREGSAGPGPNVGAGVFFSDISSAAAPVVNSSGKVMFRAVLTGAGVTSSNNQGLWVTENGSLTAIARNGTSPGPNLGAGVNFAFFNNLYGLNEHGEAAFTADLTGTGINSTNNTGLWLWSGGTLNLIAREGDTFDIDPNPQAQTLRTVSGIGFVSAGKEPRPTVLNDHGQLVFRLTFTDGSSGIFTSLFRQPGDFNLDGSITSADLPEMLNALTDLEAYQSRYGLSDAQLLAIGDINQDYSAATGSGGFNNRDIQPFLDLLQSQGGGSIAAVPIAAVPEPASIGLAIVGLGGLIFCKSRSCKASKRKRPAIAAGRFVSFTPSILWRLLHPSWISSTWPSKCRHSVRLIASVAFRSARREFQRRAWLLDRAVAFSDLRVASHS